MVQTEEEEVVAAHVFELDLILHCASLQVDHRQITANGLHNPRLVDWALSPVRAVGCCEADDSSRQGTEWQTRHRLSKQTIVSQKDRWWD